MITLDRAAAAAVGIAIGSTPVGLYRRYSVHVQQSVSPELGAKAFAITLLVLGYGILIVGCIVLGLDVGVVGIRGLAMVATGALLAPLAAFLLGRLRAVGKRE